MWYDLLKVRDVYLKGRTVKIENGKSTRFWEDCWVFDRPLCLLTPELYTLCEQKEITVDRVKSGEIQLSFRRWLTPELRNVWDKIWALVVAFPLSENHDMILWKWDKKGSSL
jgi:hypothetical protein